MPALVSDLLTAWLAALPAGTDVDAGVAAGRELLDRWREPHRQYHTVEHLTAVLAVLDELRAPPVVTLAAWFHDAVYDPTRPDNEERSAALAGTVLDWLGIPADEVVRLVRLTAGHDPAADDEHGKLLCDADLAILATPPAGYQDYVRAIRAEYGHVPDAAFRLGRVAVLRQLLELPELYRTAALRERWETRARANINAELAALDAG